LENEVIKAELQEIADKFNRPHVIWLAIGLLWVGLLLSQYLLDKNMGVIQTYVNEHCSSYGYMAFDMNTNRAVFEPPTLNISDIPVIP
jgi:hypothetical protein